MEHMKFCPKCQAQLLGNTKVCPHCGFEFEHKKSFKDGVIFKYRIFFIAVFVCLIVMGIKYINGPKTYDEKLAVAVAQRFKDNIKDDSKFDIFVADAYTSRTLEYNGESIRCVEMEIKVNNQKIADEYHSQYGISGYKIGNNVFCSFIDENNLDGVSNTSNMEVEPNYVKIDIKKLNRWVR